MIEITRETIDPSIALDHVASKGAGAAVLFLGTTREVTGKRRTVRLEYDCYGEMAERKLAEMRVEAMTRWPLAGCAIIHRIGVVDAGESSVAVAVSSPHRTDALEAAKWLIDTLKQVVPIWKKEHWDDGTSEWVHPGLVAPAVPSDPS